MAWTSEQRKNASTIIAVGQKMGMSSRDIQIALATAIVESGLRNLNYGDRDSLGLFQQRPSQGWGSPEQVTDPVYAAGKFYKTLRRVKGRDNMSISAAAQAVQRSAFPDRYGEQAGAAAGLFASLQGGVAPSADAGAVTTSLTDATGIQQGSVGVGDLMGDTLASVPANGADFAPASVPGSPAPSTPATSVNEQSMATNSDAGTKAFLGSHGAGEGAPDVGNPVEDNRAYFQPVDQDAYRRALLSQSTAHTTTTGGGVTVTDTGVQGSGVGNEIASFAKKFIGVPYVWGGTGPTGFDCSGLTQYVLGHFGINIPRISYQQGAGGRAVDSLKNAKAGDLLFWDNSPRNPGADHVALYIGNGMMISAPRPGESVHMTKVTGDPWIRSYIGND